MNIHKLKYFKNKNELKLKILEAKCFNLKNFGSKKLLKNFGKRIFIKKMKSKINWIIDFIILKILMCYLCFILIIGLII